MVSRRSRSIGFLFVCLCALCLLACGDPASNGIFNLNAATSEDWIGSLKYSYKSEYPIPAPAAGEALQFPEFSKLDDLMVWAIYYDGSSQIVPNSNLQVTVGGAPAAMAPMPLNFIGKVTVNVTYKRWKFSYPIVVGTAGSGDDGSSDDGTGINIVITY